MKITGRMWNAFVEATEEGMCFATSTKGFEAALAAAIDAEMKETK